MMTSIALAAEAMGVGVRSLTVQVATGRYPGRKVDGRWYLPTWFIRSYEPARVRHPPRLAFIDIDGIRLTYAFTTNNERRTWLRSASRWAETRNAIVGLLSPQNSSDEDRIWSFWTLRTTK